MNAPAFDPKTVKRSAGYDTPDALFAVAQDEPRRKLYGAGMDGALYAVDLAAEKPAVVRQCALHDNYVATLALRDGVLISGGFDRMLVWTDAVTGKRIRALPAHDGWVRKLVLTPDCSLLVSVGDDMQVKVWQAQTGKLLHTFAGHAKQTPEGYVSALYAVAVSPDGKIAASGDRVGNIRVWDLAADKAMAEFRAADFYTFDAQKRARAIGGVRGLAFSPDGAQLAISGIGPVTNVDGFVGPCRVETWDWRKAQRIAVGQEKHQAILNHVAFGPSPDWLVAAGGGDSGGALFFWNPASSTPPHLAKPKGHIHSFVVDASSRRLITASHGGFQVWDWV